MRPREATFRFAINFALPIGHAPRDESAPATLRPELSWTHYRLLLGVELPEARDWYLREAADQHWSTRQLERQISVLYYERLLTSRKKAPVRKEAAAKLAAAEPAHFIRDPYVLEFLDLKDYPALRESAVEQAIIDNLHRAAVTVTYNEHPQRRAEPNRRSASRTTLFTSVQGMPHGPFVQAVSGRGAERPLPDGE